MQELISKRSEALEKSNATLAAKGHLQGNDEIGISLKPLEAQNISRTQMLWDGLVQLNSSLVVSVVTFFKSGEKMPDGRWPELVEVKGKVRLEGFEKYIQELSRSRNNRGLMVTSLCWKKGTSKSGLAGMKKVADSYKADRRVGLAQISEGIELYICPRSDAIITVLAKHGFFKGMFAIEENQDSLIGCVVWRRAKAVANSVPEKKNPSFKEQSRDSESACKKPSPVAKDCSTPGSASSCASENQNVELKLHNSLASSSFLQILSALRKSVSISGPDNVGPADKSPRAQTLGPEKHKPKDPRVQTLSLPSVDIKDHLLTPDDDELPEFDFGLGLLAENYKKINLPALNNKRKLENVRTNEVIMKFPRLMEVRGRHPISTLLSFSERIAQNRALIRQYGATSDTPPKIIFDEEPMWGPPEIARHKISRPTLIRSELPISTRTFAYTDRNFGLIPAQVKPGHEFAQMAFRASASVGPHAQPFDHRSRINPHGSRVLKL